MRQYIILILLALTTTTLSAQPKGDSLSNLINADLAEDETANNASASESASYSGNSNNQKKFEVNREKIVYRRVFQVNNAETPAEVYERAKNYARLLNVNYKENKGKKSITVPVTWTYHGGYNECVEDLDLKGDMLIEVKGTKTRISLMNITYKHFDRKNAMVKGVAKSDIFSRKPDCAPDKGKVELLYNCTACPESLESVTGAMKNQFDIFAKQYQDSLRWH